MGGQAIRNKETMKRFGKKLREIRKEKNMSQEELAYKAGIAHSQITKIETGQINTTISTVVVIAKALDIQAGELFEIPGNY